jgi:hypothetical protein
MPVGYANFVGVHAVRYGKQKNKNRNKINGRNITSSTKLDKYENFINVSVILS